MTRQTARDVMTTNVMAVESDWPLHRLAEFFIENGISGAPVIDKNGTPIGVVSNTDLVLYHTIPVEKRAERKTNPYYQALDDVFLPEEVEGYRVNNDSAVRVSDIMTPVLFEVDVDTSVEEIATTMTHGRIHRLLVSSDKRLIGIITALDLVKLLTRNE